MEGALAQLVALALHGSVWLAEPGALPCPQLDATHSTFAGVGDTRFLPPPARFRRTDPLIGVRRWLEWLRQVGTDRVALVHRTRTTAIVHPQLRADLVATEGWFLLGEGVGNRELLWIPTWISLPDGGTNVRYRGAPTRGRRSRDGEGPPSLTDAAATLARELDTIASCAVSLGYDEHAALFRRALSALSASDPIVPEYPDLCPDQMSLSARQLLVASWGALAGLRLPVMASGADSPPLAESSPNPGYAALARALATPSSLALEVAANANSSVHLMEAP